MPSEVAPGVHRVGNALRQLLPDRGRQPADARRRGRARLPPAARRVPALARAQRQRHRRRDPHARARRPRRDGRGRARRRARARPRARGRRAHGPHRQGPQARRQRCSPTSATRRRWKLLAIGARDGALKPPKIGEVTTFTGGDLDVPGRPRVIPTPGHSPGHVAFHLPDRGVLIAGDALCAYNPLTGAPRPAADAEGVRRGHPAGAGSRWTRSRPSRRARCSSATASPGRMARPQRSLTPEKSGSRRRLPALS